MPRRATYLLPMHKRRTGMLPYSLILSLSCTMLAKSSIQATQNQNNRQVPFTEAALSQRPIPNTAIGERWRSTMEPVGSLYTPLIQQMPASKKNQSINQSLCVGSKVFLLREDDTREDEGGGGGTPVLQETTLLRGLSVQCSSQKSLSSCNQLLPLSCPARIAVSPRIPQVSHACVLRSARGIDVAMRRPPVLEGNGRQEGKGGWGANRPKVSCEPPDTCLIWWRRGVFVCMLCVCRRTHVLKSHQCSSDHVTPAGRPTAVCLPTNLANTSCVSTTVFFGGGLKKISKIVICRCFHWILRSA